MTFNTDKTSHGYIPTYAKIAEEIGPAGIVCELGVELGGSLDMWLEFFPDGKVVGVDLDPLARWPNGSVKIVTDQTDKRLGPLLTEISPTGEYDLIVDDCSHFGEPTEASWEMLWSLVRSGGYYIIEDWFVGIPGNNWHGMYGTSMLEFAQKLLTYLSPPGRYDIDSIEYKYGLIIVRKLAARTMPCPPVQLRQRIDVLRNPLTQVSTSQEAG